MFDTIIRGGAVVDGRGGAPFTADIGIKNGRIAEVGKVTAPAAREIDAEGAVVTPGFIDVTRKCPSLVAHLHPGDPIHVLNLGARAMRASWNTPSRFVTLGDKSLSYA